MYGGKQQGNVNGQYGNQLHVPPPWPYRERAGSAGSTGSKRPREEQVSGGDGFTPVPPRRNRKTNYGKSTVVLEGVEAAPVDIFVGNTNPRATGEKIKQVLLMSAEQMPEKPTLVIHDVKCLNNLDVEPNPRTRCWKITVPYANKDLMADDNLYPAGWSHRRF